jgi:hypothetical protein
MMYLAEEQKAMRERHHGKKDVRCAPKPVVDEGVLTFEAASEKYHARQALKARLRRHSSVSLAQRLELKQLAVAHMGGSCRLCGYSKCLRALEFHHRERQNKEFSIASFISSKVFFAGLEEVWELIKKELLKCVLLCANCHREVEAGLVTLASNS